MENNTYKQMQIRNTETENRKQKLITEFTPSTRLRLRVPIQWELIQLILLKMVQVVLDSANQFRQHGKKSPRPLHWNNTNWISKQREAKYNREDRSTLNNHRN